MSSVDRNRTLHKLFGVIPNPMSLDRALGKLNPPNKEPFSVGELRRRATDMSQAEFAESYQIKLPTLRKWELEPDRVTSAVRAYLSLIEKAPNLVLFLLESTTSQIALALGEDFTDDQNDVFDLKHLRKQRLGLTREQFSYKYAVNLNSLIGWEGKPESMTSPVKAYISMINKAPELVHDLLVASTKEEVEKIMSRIDFSL